MSSSECYKCHKTGHFSRDCSSGGGDSRGSSRVSCYNCGRSGHFARECRESDKTCYSCGKSGHIRRECNRGYPPVICLYCEKGGHAALDCPVEREREIAVGKCNSCGESGHIGRDCPEGNTVYYSDDEGKSIKLYIADCFPDVYP